ncbi:MAG: hypothetical protein HZA46_00710 [Planctomycetales bacterium]|nr:hypothetical protein [Planctomycetales bacterium]
MPPRITSASIIRRTASLLSRIAASSWTTPVGHGLLCGAFMLVWMQQTISLFGTTPPVTFAMTGAVAFGVLLALWKRTDETVAANSVPDWTARQVASGLLVGLAGWSVVYPVLLDGFARLVTISGTHLESNLSAVVVVVPALLLCLSPMAWVTVRLVTCLGNEMRSSSGMATDEDDAPCAVLAPFSIGFGLGVLSSGLWLAPWLGLDRLTLVCAGVIAVWATVRVLRPQQVASSSRLELRDLSAAPTRNDNETSLTLRVGVDFVLIAVSGGLFAAWRRMAHQLVPQTSHALAGEIASVAVGLSLGIMLAGWLARRRNANGALVRLRLAVGLVMWSVVAVAAFPWLTHGALWLNAFVWQTSWLSLGRVGLTALLLAPIGFAFGLTSVGDVKSVRWRVAVQVSLALAGYWLTTLAVTSPGNPAVVSLCIAAVLLVSVSLQWRTIVTSAPSRIGWIGWATPVLLLACSPLCLANYTPAVTARLLFSTGVFNARRGGVEPSQLLRLDDGRLLQVLEGSRGTFTVWKHNGHQIHLREDGVPSGAISTDADIFPQYSAEVLPAALPLILHETPLRVMVLGLGSGVPLGSTLSFPVQEVVCIEPDRVLLRLANEVLYPHPETNPLADNRLRLVTIDPVLAMLGTPPESRFDVIVSHPDHSFLARSAPCFTRQFYQHVANHLTPAGIFSQRFQMVDYGPEPLRCVVATLQSVFREVALLEVAPGELALLATNDDRGLIRPLLAERVATPHCRALLARMGVDWSSLLVFGGYSHETLAKFVANGRAEPNTVSNSRLALSLPREVMRWGPKLSELQASLGNQGSTLAMWLGDHDDLSEAIRRQQEVTEQLELMDKYADQYWAYRSKVKELVTKRPLSPIQQVNYELGGKKMHSVDARRLKYFEALGQAAQSKQLADIDRVAEFETPYDPLVSFFLHQELAELLARSSERDPVRELRHRWHSLYFSSVKDRSVRTVCDTVNLLLDDPAAEPNLLQRRDNLDALLQLLVNRWTLRYGTKPKSTQSMLHDIDVTMKTVDRAYDSLTALTVECGLPAENWTARQAVLHQSLVRPLRNYRDQLLPIHQQNLSRLRALQAKE